MKTIAQQLNIKEFPFKIRDGRGNLIYYENANGWWEKTEYDLEDEVVYHENSVGEIFDKRFQSCDGKVVEIDGKKYKLKEM